MGEELTMGSLFDGSGAFPLASIMSGIKPVWASEICPYPIRVTTKRLPFMKHYGDVSAMDGGKVEPVDVITFGSPCQDMSIAGKREGLDGARSGLFHQAVRIMKEMKEATDGEYPKYAVWENVCFDADTLVTCKDGYKRIADIGIGDEVKTLSGGYHSVARVHITPKQHVINLVVSGAEDLKVTPNHPFWARKKLDKCGKQNITQPGWVKAEDLTTRHLIGYRLDKQEIPDSFISDEEAWVLGRWIADGSADLKKSNPRIFISCGLKKAQELREHLAKLPYSVYENKPHETAINFCFTSAEFYRLISKCGVGAVNKRIPAFVFALSERKQKAVLDGYISGDGYIRTRSATVELSAGAVSRELAYGICRLIRNTYHVASNISVEAPKDGVIKGRVLHANYPGYSVTASISSKVSLSVYDGEFVWQPVKGIVDEQEYRTVYNLSVMEDNTYAANDVSVHNCGALSSNGGGETSGAYSKAYLASLKKKYLFLDLTNGKGRGSSWEKVSPSRGGCYPRNISASPREENASTLSQILVATAPEKYYLSVKACLGILRRASERGKALPPILEAALRRQAGIA